MGGLKEPALQLRPNLAGLSPGPHAFHLHENPACGPGEKNGVMVPGLGAGAHLFAGTTSGKLYTSHLGDLPDLKVAEDGTAKEDVIAPRLTMADLQGRSIMVHASQDDASGRMACGVIK